MNTLENAPKVMPGILEEFEVLHKLIDETNSSVSAFEQALAGVLKTEGAPNSVVPAKDASGTSAIRVYLYAAQAKMIELDARIEVLISRVDL